MRLRTLAILVAAAPIALACSSVLSIKVYDEDLVDGGPPVDSTTASSMTAEAAVEASTDDATSGDETATDEGDAGPTSVPDAIADVAADADAAPGSPTSDASEAAAAPVCQGTCAPPVPQGWTGPLELYSGAAPAPTCPTGTAQDYKGNAGLQGNPAECTCACAATGVQCTVPVVMFTTADCKVSEGVCNTFQVGSTCVDMSACNPEVASAYPVTATGGTCTASVVTTVPPATWQGQVLSCLPTPVGSCSSGVCVPAMPAAFSSGYCIRQVGDVACPAGDYSHKSSSYGSMTDNRACGACTCGAISGATCTATVSEYGESACVTPAVGSISAPTACQGLTVITAAMKVTSQQVTGGCAAGAATPSGSAVPAQPTTFCCTQ